MSDFSQEYRIPAVVMALSVRILYAKTSFGVWSHRVESKGIQRKIYILRHFISSMKSTFNIFDKQRQSSPKLIHTGGCSRNESTFLTFLTKQSSNEKGRQALVNLPFEIKVCENYRPGTG
jgi:hypothetical protein